MFEKLFKLKQNQTSIKSEVLAGFTVFSIMAYIILVNPQILSLTGMDFDSVMLATILTSALATLVMGLWANYPFALAPGMGLNAYFTYSIVLNAGHPWPVALGSCFLAGAILLILTLLNLRQKLLQGIPPCLRLSVAGGIGLFLAFIGLKNAEIIIPHALTLVTLGDMMQPSSILTGIGIILIAALMTLRVKGAILISILAIWLLGLVFGLSEWQGFVSLPPSLSPTFGKLDVWALFNPDIMASVIAFVFVALFDTTGTLIALAEQGNFLDVKGHLPRASRALIPDGLGTSVGAILGTSPVTTYLESASGIAAGGRTGLTSLTISGLFLLAIFFSPLAKSIPLFATAPALITIGALMLRQITKLNWEDPSEFLPAFIILISIPLTFSIATGISLGFILYPLIKLLCGKFKEVNKMTWLIAALFLLRYIYLT